MSVDIITFGCRLNARESQVIKKLAAGEQNTVIVNTCAVTAEAVRQARQAIRKAHRQNPSARLIATGCAVQLHPDSFANMPEADLILGNQDKMHAAAYTHPKGVFITPTPQNPPSQSPQSSGTPRAFVQIQNGCNHACTFCIVPKTRGPARDAPPDAIIAHIRQLCQKDVQEVVLTGVDLTSYRTPSLGTLVKQILHQVPELPRLRLSSLDPAAIDETLLGLLEDSPRLMPHLHLSVQAGDNLTLKRMRRRHSRDDVLHLCDQVRTRRPETVFGADLIAGFPTETQAMFEKTLHLVEEAALTYLHVFPFSPRPGTPAARMPAVPPAVARARAQQLRRLGEKQLFSHLSGTLSRTPGHTRHMLTETSHTGWLDSFEKVHLSQKAPVGAILPVRLETCDHTRLYGRIVTEPPS